MSLISSWTSLKRRPMNRLIEKTVFSGFVMAWRLAIWPTRISPSFVKPTTDGVSRLPSWLGMTVAVPPSMTATTEFVVPRSMPITLAMLCSCHWSCAASDRTRRGPSSRSAERDLDGHVELRVVRLHLVRSVLGPELFRDVTDTRRIGDRPRRPVDGDTLDGEADPRLLQHVLEPRAVRPLHRQQEQDVAVLDEPHRARRLTARCPPGDSELHFVGLGQRVLEFGEAHGILPGRRGCGGRRQAGMRAALVTAAMRVSASQGPS